MPSGTRIQKTLRDVLRECEKARVYPADIIFRKRCALPEDRSVEDVGPISVLDLPRRGKEGSIPVFQDRRRGEQQQGEAEGWADGFVVEVLNESVPTEERMNFIVQCGRKAVGGLSEFSIKKAFEDIFDRVRFPGGRDASDIQRSC